MHAAIRRTVRPAERLRAISPMPPSEPTSDVISSGTITIFWLGEVASLPNASTYFWAMK